MAKAAALRSQPFLSIESDKSYLWKAHLGGGGAIEVLVVDPSEESGRAYYERLSSDAVGRRIVRSMHDTQSYGVRHAFTLV